MKKKDLEKKLSRAGWWLARHGGNHDIWTNGNTTTQIPRHPEVNELLAKSIIKIAEKNPGEKNR
ncbi:MAG: type II toxin-antitoxin system HicA family toxin [Parachlamydiaceae bacterium]